MEGTFADPNMLVGGELHPDTKLPIVPLLVVVIGAFMAILDSSIVNVAIPKLMAVFGVGADKIEWVVTGYLLGSGVVVPPTGFLADRVGMKKMYIFALGVFTLGSALCSLAWSSNILIGFRVLQAVGGGMIMPLSMSIMYSMVPREKIGVALGLWGIAAAAAPSIGPTLGGYLVDRFDWRLIFTINIPVGIFAVLLVLIFLPEFPGKPHLQFDLPGALLAAYGSFALLLALSEGQDKGWTSVYILTFLVTGGFSFLLFALWEIRQREPMIDIRLLKNAVFTVSLVATAFTTIGLYSTMYLVPFLVQNLLGYTPLQAGLMMLPMGLTMGLLMPVSGRLFDRVGAFWPAFIGLSLAAGVTFRMHTLGLLSSYHGIQITLVFWAVGVGLSMMPLGTAGLYTIPAPLVNQAAALSSLVRQIAGSMGIAYLSYVMLSREIYHYNWLAGTVTYSSSGGRILPRLASYLGTNGAISTLSGIAMRQSLAMGIDDAFLVGSIIIVLAVPLAFFLTKGRVDAARARQLAAFANEVTK